MNKQYIVSAIAFSLILILPLEARVTKQKKEASNKTVEKTKEEPVNINNREAPINQFKARENAIPEEFDIEAKRNDVKELVDKAATAFEQSKNLESIFNAITHEPTYKKGELYIFVYDFEGTCMAIGQHTAMVWQNFFNYRDQFGFAVVQNMIEHAKKGGGWLTYEWRGTTKVSYVKQVKKFGKDYVIGSGYYPFSKKDNVVSLVKGAVSLFNKCIEEKRPISEAFAEFGYPKGRFVLGDLYIYALTFNGEHVAHGERPGLIGSNGWDYKDSEGKYVNREIVEKLKKTSDGVWVDYVSKGTIKSAYAEKVKDAKGIEYFIACGYYPEASRKEVVNLVDKGYKYMKSHGISQAADEFNNLDSNEFRFGDLYLFVLDKKGICRAEGANAQLVGSNMFDERDEDGRYWVRAAIDKAENGGGWVDFKFKNSFKSIYVEMIDMGVEKLIIGSGTYPTTKMESMILLAKSASGFLSTVKDSKEAFAEFVRPLSNKFLRGDLFIFVFEKSGICFAYGDDHDLLWKNLSYMKDAEGQSLVSLLDEAVERGPSKVMYSFNNNSTIAYVESVERDGRTYIIGSSFIQ